MSDASESQSHLKVERCHKVLHSWWSSDDKQRCNSCKTVTCHFQCPPFEVSVGFQDRTVGEMRHLLLRRGLYLSKKIFISTNLHLQPIYNVTLHFFIKKNQTIAG